MALPILGELNESWFLVPISFERTLCQVAAKQTKLAIVAPVTNPTEDSPKIQYF